VQHSFDTQDKIALFAFRKSQKVFFENILSQCKKKNIHILSTKKALGVSFKALQYVKKADLHTPYRFAVDEFYAKTNLKIPKVLIGMYFKFFARVNFLRYYALLNHGYTKMLIWNGGKFRQLIALEVAKILNIKVYFFENGLLPNTIVFDEKGINFDNSVPREKSFFQKYSSEVSLPSSLVPRVGKNRDIFKGEKGRLPDKYIFVPFQVDYDTQIISHSHWIQNMRMLFAVIENIAPFNAYHFIFKEHPSSGIEYSDLHQKAEKYENISFRNTHTTQELIENAVAVITINSTVGIEALLFHKKVIVLGDAFYGIEDITFLARDENELALKIDHIEKLHFNDKLVDNFLKYLYNDYLVPKNNEMYDIFCQKMLKNRL